MMKRRQMVLTMGALAAQATLGCEVESAPNVPAARNASVAGLDTEEAQGLRFMRQEEKLARDVYQTLGAAHPLRVFDNIAASEQRHMDAVRGLLERYRIDDPVAQLPTGRFENQALQRLHDELVERGLTSLEEALRVGALIEETDILDLRQRAEQTNESPIQIVYSNLEKASHNHLRAFVRQLDRIGVDYAPERLPLEDYSAILNDVTARRGPSRGGHGPRQRAAPRRRGRPL